MAGEFQAVASFPISLALCRFMLMPCTLPPSVLRRTRHACQLLPFELSRSFKYWCRLWLAVTGAEITFREEIINIGDIVYYIGLKLKMTADTGNILITRLFRLIPFLSPLRFRHAIISFRVLPVARIFSCSPACFPWQSPRGFSPSHWLGLVDLIYRFSLIAGLETKQCYHASLSAI